MFSCHASSNRVRPLEFVGIVTSFVCLTEETHIDMFKPHQESRCFQGTVTNRSTSNLPNNLSLGTVLLFGGCLLLDKGIQDPF